MAMQTIPGGLCWPACPITDDVTSIATVTAVTLNGLDDVHMLVGKMPATGTIQKYGFNIATNASFSGTVKARIETVDATNGQPTGTLVAGGAEFELTDETTGWQKVTIGTPPSVTGGNLVAIGLRTTAYSSGSMTVTGFHPTNFRAGETYFPVEIYNASSKGNGPSCHHIELDDASLVQFQNVLPCIGLAADSWDELDNPNRRGLRFKFPFPVEISGFWANTHNYTTDLNWHLYDSDGTTELETQAIDDDIGFSGALAYRFFPMTPRTLTKDVFYRLVLAPQDTIARQVLKLVEVGEVASLDAWGGQNFHYTTVNDAPTAEGDWTQTTTKCPVGFGLFLTAFDDGAGGGGETFTGSVINRGIN